MLRFGVTVLPDPPSTRFVELVQMAEEHGFENGWTYDSQILWHESYPLLAMGSGRRRRMKFGHCVTNPAPRADDHRERVRDAARRSRTAAW